MISYCVSTKVSIINHGKIDVNEKIASISCFHFSTERKYADGIYRDNHNVILLMINMVDEKKSSI